MTRPEEIVRWMKPEAFTIVACESDARTGRSYRYTFEAGPRKIEVRGRCDSVAAPGYLRYTDSCDFSPLVIGVVTMLEEQDALRRFIQTLTYRTEKERAEDFPGVASSAKALFPILDRYLQGG